MDAQHQPAVIGSCSHCRQPVYASAPIAKPTIEARAHCEVLALSHVGCAVDSRRVH